VAMSYSKVKSSTEPSINTTKLSGNGGILFPRPFKALNVSNVVFKTEMFLTMLLSRYLEHDGYEPDEECKAIKISCKLNL